MNANDDKEDRRLLELLDAIERRSDVSQRHLASRLGVALGLTNSYLRRCIRKGLVKIKEAPANRYFYYLTPKGFSEKSRLTARYFASSFGFYREAGESCRVVFAECEKRAWRRVVLCGASDLAEIALLRAQESSVVVVGLVDRGARRQSFLGYALWPSIEAAGRFDGCVITDLRSPRATCDRLVSELGHDRVVVPNILRL